MNTLTPEQLVAALQSIASQVADEVAGLRADMTTQLEGLRSEVHGLASRLGPVEEAIAQQTREADLAAAREEGARELARRLGYEDMPNTASGLDGPPSRPRWASTASTALDLVGTRGGLAVLGTLLTMWMGPEVAGSIADLAAALTVDTVEAAPLPVPFIEPEP